MSIATPDPKYMGIGIPQQLAKPQAKISTCSEDTGWHRQSARCPNIGAVYKASIWVAVWIEIQIGSNTNETSLRTPYERQSGQYFNLIQTILKISSSPKMKMGKENE